MIYFTSEELASLAAARYCTMPLIIQDLCITCAPYPYRPRWPRENIYRGQDPPEITPAALVHWA